MESLPGHSWREYLFSGEHHQVADPVRVDGSGMVWAACNAGGVAELWADEPDPDGETRCVTCLVRVGTRAAVRRSRHIADTGSQTPAAFLALRTDGPAVRAVATRLHVAEVES
jgi:hypothetical protein